MGTREKVLKHLVNKGIYAFASELEVIFLFCTCLKFPRQNVWHENEHLPDENGSVKKRSHCLGQNLQQELTCFGQDASRLSIPQVYRSHRQRKSSFCEK